MTTTLITTRSGFHDALRGAFETASARGSRELWLCDQHYGDWPLGERAVIESLTRWATSTRRLTMFAASFDEVARRHPRFVDWRRQWAHIVSCRTNPELVASDVPTFLIASGTLCVHLIDPTHQRGAVSDEKADETRHREHLDALLQRSVEAFPASTTGL